MTTSLGIIGIGKLGSAVGRLALEAGHRVLVLDAGRPMQQLILTTVLPGAQMVDVATLVAQSDVILLAVPRRALADVPIEELAASVVIDATNAWEATDGIAAPAEGPSALLARNPRLRLVKTLNHLAYTDLLTDARPVGAPDRRALGVSGADTEAVALVAQVVDELGFDAVRLGPETGPLLEPAGPVFGRRLTAPDLAAALTIATPTSAVSPDPTLRAG